MTERRPLFHFRPHIRTLSDLVAEARAYAEGALRAAGAVRPTVLALTPRGMVAHYPERMKTAADKEQFALECRLLLVATQATVCAMVLESWMTDTPEGKLPELPPSRHPKRREVVTVCAESRKEQRFLTFPIKRTVLGVFTGLGENSAPAGLTSSGRFASLLPSKVPSSKDVYAAQITLEAIGIRIGTGGFSSS